jgi:hypothetical protein
MLEYLKFKFNLFGIDAPAFAWVVAAFLILFTAIHLERMLRQLRQQRRNFRDASEHIKTSVKNVEAGKGLSLGDYEEINKYFDAEATGGLNGAWREFKSHFLLRKLDSGENLYWSTRNAEEAFSERKLVTEKLSRDYYQSLPGIITGIGLMTTFFAILVALLDVRLVDNRVQGLELLIQGLSGKFITSVVALLCATVFVFFEKNRFHALEKSQLKLASLIDLTVPQLSPVHILVDLQTNFGQLHKDTNLGFAGLRDEIKQGIESIVHADSANIGQLQSEIKQGIDSIRQSTILLQEDVANQTVCIQDFNTSLAPMLQQTFDESMTPAMNRMIKSIEDMNEFLRSVEANKSDSITDSIKELLTNLQTSLTGSISEMGGKFNESLSGNAQQQFASVADSLLNTTAILDGMNQQFSSSQNALQEMIIQARSTTQEQININHNQLNSLAETIGSLMIDLSERVNNLGEKMSASVQANSENAVGAADRVIKRANEWSTENAAQLTRLLEVHQSQFERVVQTRELLDGTIVKFNGSLENLMKISLNSRTSVQQINAAVTSITSAADKTATTHQSLQKISDSTAEQLEELSSAHHRQREMWTAIHNTMEQYKQTFSTVENSAGALLEQIGTNLENYQQVCEKGFNKLIESSDGHFTSATQKLGASVSELDEVLQDLSESFTRFDGGRQNGSR